MKILFVDDNDSVLQMLEKYFNEFPNEYQTEFAKNGAEALTKYKVFKPDIVFLDLAMPLMDGLETLIKLLKIEPLAYVFIASATGSSKIVNQCLKLGAKGYIEKPYSPQQLIDIINNTLKKGTAYSRDITLFSRCSQKIQTAISQIVSYDMQVSLENITYEQPLTSKTSINETNIHLIKEIDEIKNPKKIILSSDHFTIYCENTESSKDLFLSTMSKQDLAIFRKEINLQHDESFVMEIFNVILNSIATEITDNTNRQIRLSTPTLFVNQENLLDKNDMNQTHLQYKISRGDKSILLDVYIYLS